MRAGSCQGKVDIAYEFVVYWMNEYDEWMCEYLFICLSFMLHGDSGAQVLTGMGLGHIYVHKLMYNCSHLYIENLGLWIVCVKQQFE